MAYRHKASQQLVETFQFKNGIALPAWAPAGPHAHGSWLVRDANGKPTVLKPAEFAALYEPVPPVFTVRTPGSPRPKA